MRPSLRMHEQELRRLYADNRKDSEIAAALRVHHDTVLGWRLRLGLATKFGRAEGGRTATPTNRRRAILIEGESDWGGYMMTCRRMRYAKEWPGCCSRTGVMICRYLAEHGGQTITEIAKGCEKQADSIRYAMRGLLFSRAVRRDGYLYHLSNRGEEE